MLDSPHNLHAYEEAGIPFAHVAIGRHDEWAVNLPVLYRTLATWLADPDEVVLIHHEEFGDRLLGVLAGYLIYSGLVQEGPHAVVVIEKITGGNSARTRVRSCRSRSPRASSPSAGRVRPQPVRAVSGRHHEAGATGSMGTIQVKGLRELGIHGVLPEEKQRPQPFEVDVELTVDISTAGETDGLDDTVDYSAVSEAVSRVVRNESYQLLERLATRIAEVCCVDLRASPACASRCASCTRRSCDGRLRRGHDRELSGENLSGEQ